MLPGFRFCRLAGGFFWHGLAAAQKHLQPRWPEQLVELRDMLTAAHFEGVSFEYWSPPPYWKANRAYIGCDDRTTACIDTSLSGRTFAGYRCTPESAGAD